MQALMSKCVKLLYNFTRHLSTYIYGLLVSVSCRRSFLRAQTMEEKATAPEAIDETGTTKTAFLCQHPSVKKTLHLPTLTWIEPLTTPKIESTFSCCTKKIHFRHGNT